MGQPPVLPKNRLVGHLYYAEFRFSEPTNPSDAPLVPWKAEFEIRDGKAYKATLPKPLSQPNKLMTAF